MGASDGRSVAELDSLLWYNGYRVSDQLLASLAAAGLVALRNHDPTARVTLTEAGSRALIELAAAAKAAEAHAERNLGTAEIRALKRALRVIISETDPGAPPAVDPEEPARGAPVRDGAPRTAKIHVGQCPTP